MYIQVHYTTLTNLPPTEPCAADLIFLQYNPLVLITMPGDQVLNIQL